MPSQIRNKIFENDIRCITTAVEGNQHGPSVSLNCKGLVSENLRQFCYCGVCSIRECMAYVNISLCDNVIWLLFVKCLSYGEIILGIFI